MGVVVRRYIDFLILIIPTCICSFLQQHPYFLFIFKMFFFLFIIEYIIIYIYIIEQIKMSRTQKEQCW